MVPTEVHNMKHFCITMSKNDEWTFGICFVDMALYIITNIHQVIGQSGGGSW